MARFYPDAEELPRELKEVAEPAVDLAHKWVTEASTSSSGSSALLAQVLKDEKGLAFTIGFVDRVVRPEDLRAAAHNLRVLAADIPHFLPWYLRVAVRLGGHVAPLFPWPVVSIARGVLRRMVGHLVVDARPAKLRKTLDALKRSGARLNLNLLGEAVLGDAEAQRRFDGTRDLLERDDVDYVSIKVSSVVSQLSMWDFDEEIRRVVEKLTPLYEIAARSRTPKFINLDMEEYRDLDLTLKVFTELLDQPQLRALEAGIVLQTYLPEARGALEGITEWARRRVDSGGAPVKVRLVKGANLPMEQVDAAIHGWPLTTYERKQDSDTNYKRVIDYALQPDNAAVVKVGVAGHNLFDIAFAHLLSERRGVTERVEFEMLLGMAEGQSEQVKQTVGDLLLYTPVVHPREFDVAISYLIRRLEENASHENFMSAVFQLAADEDMFVRERDRFLASLTELTREIPRRHRTQSRLTEAPQPREGGFGNEPDTDPALPDNREWGRGILKAARSSERGSDVIAAATVSDPEQLDRIIGEAVTASAAWASHGGVGRASILRRAAQQLAIRRGELLEVMANEAGKTIAEGDVEVSEAIDFANYYALLAEELDHVEAAEFLPSQLTVVTPPWNFPLAIPAGSTLASLAAGSAVVIKPARQSKRTGAMMVQALWDAGVPREVLRLVDLEERDLGQQLVSHPAVDRVLLTGAFETAQLFRSWRPDLNLLAETSGKNGIIVTPSADLDLAVADIVKSAFGHAGQKCSAASIVILVGSVADSERFERQLLDAASTLRVGQPVDASTQMGPIIEPATGKLLDALTRLDVGEQWLLEPRQLDYTGKLWSPGIKTGVREGSYYHRTEFFGPVLGIMRAATLEDAVRIQNGTDFGLTAGLHTLDRKELEFWLDRVEAGNLYVNRGITGAIVRRQSFGGWKRSVVGATGKAGGPNYLVHLGEWRPKALSRPADKLRGPLLPAVEKLVLEARKVLPSAAATALQRAVESDQRTWESEFGVVRDVSNLGVERNVFRYLPAVVTVRAGEASALIDTLRVVAAGLRSGASVSLSLAASPAGLDEALSQLVQDIAYEDDASWHYRAAEVRPERIRLIGGGHRSLAKALDGDAAVAIYAGQVTESGRLELLPFLLEQAVTITAHRFGSPDNWSDDVLNRLNRSGSRGRSEIPRG